ncbi:hypothetical protein M9H77_03113 [Catharanthus roseus]|uniref:Uncharacterized protein n=1 Tax=Catharanthus roseus TaxID=4058 RepID=A0ACC0CAH2_CATRO|nr:hypothetical protein M9H77_03113 [Catharanthus roseus]
MECNLPSPVGAKNGQESCNPRPTVDGRPYPTISGFYAAIVIDNLRELRYNYFRLHLDYSQGCLELEKEEQSRIINGDTNTDYTMEYQWASMLEQRVENMAFQSQYTHYQSAMFQENWHGYDTYFSQYSLEWRMQSNNPWGDYAQYSTYDHVPLTHL